VIRLLLIGAPGAGKGTQAEKLSAAFSIPAISTGDIFRHNVKNETELGKKAKAFMDRGEYVPDSLTNDLVRDRLLQADAQAGFLLDGYPRTEDQVAELDKILLSQGNTLSAVVKLTADTDEVVRRLLNRAIEQGRADDTEDVIRRRLDLYEEQTSPLTDVYASRGLLITIDGLGEVEEVTSRIMEAIDAKLNSN
jgi:adenylate kinase